MNNVLAWFNVTLCLAAEFINGDINAVSSICIYSRTCMFS